MTGLTDGRITTVGLLFEAHAALVRGTSASLERHGLSPQWFEALLRLARTPGHRMRMSELATSMTSITPSGLTRLVDRLEEAGLARREQCPTDRRGAFAAITDAGLARIDEVLPDHLADIERCCTGLLTESEGEQLEQALRRIRDAEPTVRLSLRGVGPPARP